MEFDLPVTLKYKFMGTKGNKVFQLWGKLWLLTHTTKIIISNGKWHIYAYTVEPLYNTIVFHQNTHKRHPIARP